MCNYPINGSLCKRRKQILNSFKKLKSLQNSQEDSAKLSFECWLHFVQFFQCDPTASTMLRSGFSKTIGTNAAPPKTKKKRKTMTFLFHLILQIAVRTVIPLY